MPVRANREGSLELIGFAREFSGGREGGALGVVHFEVQLAPHALSWCSWRAKKKEREGSTER